MKTVKKTTKKIIKPEYIVDLTKAEDGGDVLYAFTVAKVIAGKAITEDEFEYALIRTKEKVFNEAIDAIDNALFMFVKSEHICECKPKKKPWYKRMWGRLFGK